jgi:arylsulfatase A-like enzyme
VRPDRESTCEWNCTKPFPHEGPCAVVPSEPYVPRMADAAEMLWVVLANVSGGDWTKQSAEWQEAAARWRDNYFAALAELDRQKA